jgi:hypothetical protein
MNWSGRKGKHHNTCRRQPLRTYRPQLETLEDRLVPSTITGITVQYQQHVVGSDGALINTYDGLDTLADEHSTIVPNANGANDYKFYVASRTTANPISSGLVVLSGSVDNASHQWTIDTTGPSPSQTFISPVVHNIAVADPTFDLNYAAPASVLADPTGPPGSTLMVYSATNLSIGLEPGSKTVDNGAYESVGIATSNDGGLTWPTYASVIETLPNQSSTMGPNAPFGATFTKADQGSSSLGIPGSSPAYGRYRVLGPATPIKKAIADAGNNGFPVNVGDGSPSGFIDTYNRSSSPYLYVVDNYVTGDGTSLLTVSRAALDRGSPRLKFSRWADGRFSPSATTPSAIGFLPGPKTAFQSGIDPQLQKQTAGSISYVPSTGQYLLTFVCISHGDPANGEPGLTGAWFFSTNRDLSNEAGWSQPQLIEGSDQPITPAKGPSPDILFSGWYPSFMSLSTVPQGDPRYLAPGELGLDGYVFYMSGSRGSPILNVRSFDSAYFTIHESRNDPEPKCVGFFGTPFTCESAIALCGEAPGAVQGIQNIIGSITGRTLTDNDTGDILIGGAGRNLVIADPDSSNINWGSGSSSTGGGNDADSNFAHRARVLNRFLGTLEIFDDFAEHGEDVYGNLRL